MVEEKAPDQPQEEGVDVEGGQEKTDREVAEEEAEEAAEEERKNRPEGDPAPTV